MDSKKVLLLLRFLRNLRLSGGALLGLFSLSPEFFKFFFTLAILAISLILSIFRYQETFLLLLRFLQNLRTILLQLAILGEFVILAISDRACNPAHDCASNRTDDKSRDVPVLSRDSPVHQC